MKPLAAGTRYLEEVVPTPQDLASAVGNSGVDVVSSPATILFIEMACYRAMAPLLDDGEASVGTVFDLRHVGAALPGIPLQVEVEVIEADLKRARFRAEVRQQDKLIMRGEHQRAVVDLQRLLKTPPS